MRCNMQGEEMQNKKAIRNEHPSLTITKEAIRFCWCKEIPWQSQAPRAARTSQPAPPLHSHLQHCCFPTTLHLAHGPAAPPVLTPCPSTTRPSRAGSANPAQNWLSTDWGFSGGGWQASKYLGMHTGGRPCCSVLQLPASSLYLSAALIRI